MLASEHTLRPWAMRAHVTWLSPLGPGAATPTSSPSCSLAIPPGEAAAFERGLEQVLSAARAETLTLTLTFLLPEPEP
jgi:hypothetical protein